MKKLKIFFMLIIIVLILFVSIVFGYYLYMKSTKEKQIEIANEIIDSNNQNQIEIITNEELTENENVIGILEIPKIELVAPVQEGTDLSILKVAVGHFSESSFWNGNVAFASHNRSMYEHYFERINELQLGDEIIYKTKLGTRKYTVFESKVIDETDWTVIENTNENIVTLITCINNQPESRLCVKGIENL